MFIYGYYGRMNCGDDAMLYAFLNEVAAARSDLEFHVLYGEDRPPIPRCAETRTFLVPSSTIAVAKSVTRSDIFAIVGGTHLTDYGFGLRTVAIMLRILLLVGLSRALGKEIYFVNCGLGPLYRTTTTLVTRIICRQVDAISVRDRASYDVSKSLGLKARTTLGFDLAVLVKPSGETQSRGGLADPPILGVSITPTFSIYHNSPNQDKAFVAKLGSALSAWMANHQDWKVQLFAFHGKSNLTRNDDSRITKELETILSLGPRVTVVEYNSDPIGFLEKVSHCSAFAGMKFHSCLFAYASQVPLLVIPYHPKCTALAREIGLSPETVVDLNEILNGGLGERLEWLSSHAGEVKPLLGLDESQARARAGLEVVTLGEGD